MSFKVFQEKPFLALPPAPLPLPLSRPTPEENLAQNLDFSFVHLELVLEIETRLPPSVWVLFALVSSLPWRLISVNVARKLLDCDRES